MNNITKKKIKDFAFSRGLDLIGMANIERFEGAPERMHPAAIYPEAQSVIVVGRRIVRGTWRGIEEGTYWPSYTTFGYHGLLNTHFLQLPLYETACFIEDAGYEAIPYYPGVPEKQPERKPLRSGAPAPDVHLAIRIAGTAAGIGEMGWSKVFLTPQFGPRQRLAAIITDMELEPDPLIEPGSVCDRCMRCVEGCAPDAIPHIKDKKTVKINIEDKEYEWGDVDMGKCTLSYHGGDSTVSPFIHKSFPGWNIDVKKQNMSEGSAYRFAWKLSVSESTWAGSAQYPDQYTIPGHAYLQKWGTGGSYGIEGSRGCMRSCFNHLEGRGKAGQEFKNPEFIHRKRWLLPVECRNNVESDADTDNL